MNMERFTRCEGFGKGGAAAAETRQTAGSDGGLGPIDLLREALKMLQDPYHICTFALILVIVVVPSTVVVMLTQWFEYEIIHKLVLQPPAPPAPWPDMWVVFLISVALALGSLVLAVNLVAATWYTAGSMYSGKNVSFKQVIQALPGLRKKLIITALWGHAFYFTVYLVFFVSFCVIHPFASILILPVPVLIIITLIVTSLLFFFINTILQLAYGVTVFEDDCKGFEAFVKALALVRNQWCNAFGLLLISDLPGIILGIAFTLAMLSTLDPASKCLVAGSVIFFAAVFRNLSAVTYTLFYFSTKDCHHENIKFDGIAEHTQFETHYQSIGGGSVPC